MRGFQLVGPGQRRRALMKSFLAWLASFRLRVLFRTAFLALFLAVMALAVTVLGRKTTQRRQTMPPGSPRLRPRSLGSCAAVRPAGPAQSRLECRNWPPPAARSYCPMPPSTSTTRTKVKNAVEMADCLVQYPTMAASACHRQQSLGRGYIYAAGTPQRALEAHRIGDEFLDGAHRLRVTVSLRGQTWRWWPPLSPCQAPWR